MSRRSKDPAREWSARYSAWLLIALVGWLVTFAVVLVGPALVAHGVALALGLSVGGAAGAATLTLGSSAATPANEKTHDGAAAKAARAGVTAAARRWGLALAAPAFAVTVLVLLSAFDALALRGACAVPLVAAMCPARGANEGLLGAAATTPWPIVALTGAALVLAGWALGRFLIHANKFSLHAMYRARLIRAYLGASRPAGERRPDPFTGFDEDDNVRLRDLAPNEPAAAGPRAPLHVVNVALNLVSGDSLAWQERKAASFTLTSLHAGSPFVGYRRTSPAPSVAVTGGASGGRLYASEPASLSLGTAITISGAAASPNMGYHSSPIVTFLMTLFNARLGWWLGNPGPAGDGTFHLSHPKDSIKPLLAEMFGLTTDRHEYVYLSDGGHFENLGLYEMVLRRCRYIVVSDAGCDETFSFEDLGNAIRKIRIDLGVPIEFRGGFPLYGRAAQATTKEAALGRYGAIGTIRYSCVDRPGGAVGGDAADYDPAYDGIIVYVKPSFYGRGEPRDVFNYAQSNPAFPHESTADQFFTESQFESYRALGSHIIDTILTPTDTEAVKLAKLYGERSLLEALGYGAQFHVDVRPGDGGATYDPPKPASPAWPPQYRYHIPTAPARGGAAVER